MANLDNLSVHAQLAEAAYANLLPGVPKIAALVDAGMADAEASVFAQNYLVVDSYSDLTGLSATIFQDSTGERFLAIRGTEWFDIPDLTADYILARGYPAMMNPQYAALRSQIDAWTSSGALPYQFTVTGHSLGGYLAAAVALAYGPRVESTYMFNAPGVGGIGGDAASAFRSFFGLSSTATLGRVFNVRGTAGISLIAGAGKQLAPPIYVETEDQANPIDNHRISVLSDALAVYELVGTLDPLLDAEGVSQMIRAAGNVDSELHEDPIRALYRTFGIRAAIASNDREGYWRAISDLRSGGAVRNLAGKVVLNPLASSSTGGLQSTSKTDFGDFVALKTLSPFALHPKSNVADAQSALNAIWQSAQGSDFVDWTSDKIDRENGGATDELAFTDSWYSDRAGLLRAVLTANEVDAQGQMVTVTDAVPDRKYEYHYYVDGAERVLFADPSPMGPKARSQVVEFADDAGRALSGSNNLLGDLLHGGSGDDALIGLGGDDYLEGNAGNDTLDGGADRDWLYGGAGNDILRGGAQNDVLNGGTGDDVLTGGAGNDMLVGGIGNDSYLLASGDGDDTIDDSDGLGEVRIGATKLVGGDALTDGLWQQTINGGSVLYGWRAGADGRGDLLIQSNIGTTTVKHFKSGDLGITLSTYVPGTIHVPLPTNTQSGTALDDNRNAPGRPPVVGTGANDKVLGLAGRDEVYGSTGDDIVAGGTGVDVMGGQDGNDAVFADNELTEAQLRAYIDSSAIALTAGTMPAQLSITTSEWLQGGLGDDTVAGADGNDIIFGGGGKDLLVGGAGHDVIDGDDDYDPGNITTVTIQPGVGPGAPFDVFYSAVNVNSYAGAAGAADEIHAGSGDDWVLGQLGDDSIWGDDGNDTISGGEDDDVIFGGRGNDRITGDTYGLVVGDNSTVPSGDDYIDGGEGDDDITGDGGADTIIGGAGNDSLRGNNGGVGANHLSETSADDGGDYLSGGDGDDTVIGDAGDDTLLGGNGNDTLFGDSDQTEVAYQGDDYLDGGAGNDYLRGYGGNDTLLGGAGDDQILGEAGDDYLDGGTSGVAGDVLSGGDGNDVLINAYQMMGGAGDDVMSNGTYMWGDDGNDRLSGGNWMMGGAGDDELTLASGTWLMGGNVPTNVAYGFGEAGADTLYGGAGVDQLSGGADNDVIVANDGDDIAWGDDGDDELHGGAGTDQLQGGTGNDLLYGEDGDDTLFGQEGDDTLSGGAGCNYLLGGAGNDTYLVDADVGEDVIVDDDGVNTVQFADGVTTNQLTFRPGIDATGNDRYLVIEGLAGGGRVVIAGGFDGTVGQFAFSDGSSLTAQQAHDLALAATRLPKLVSTGAYNVGPHSILGSSGNDALRAPAPGHAVYAGDGDDTLIGSAGVDSLYGGKGDDRLDGSAGDDILAGGDGKDTYVFGRGAGNDLIQEQHVLAGSGPEIDTLELAAGVLPADVRLVRDGNDLVAMLDNGPTQARIQAYYVTATDNQIEQIRFADGTLWDAAQIAARIESGTPNAMTGTAGDDTFIVDSRQDTVTEAVNGGNDTIRSSVSYVLPANVETLVLTGTLNSNAWANGFNAVSYLVGNDGNNVFDDGGNVGAYAVMSGGKGDDTYYYDYFKGGQAVENPNEGNDTIVLTRGGSLTLPANIENVRDINGGMNLDNTVPNRLLGNGLDNFLGYVGVRADIAYYIDGGAGADTMQGAERDDVYVVDDPGDRVVELPYSTGTQGDEVRSTVSYELPDNVENLTLIGSTATEGWGNELDNRLDGSQNVAANTLYGGFGNDYYVAGSEDIVVEQPGQGIDAVELHGTGTRTYTPADLPANVEGLVLGDDLGTSNLQGDAGDNILTGNASANEIDGGAGDDTLKGGAGVDTYRFSRGFGQDTIVDFVGTSHIVFDASVAPDDVYVDGGMLNLRGSDDQLHLADATFHLYGGPSVSVNIGADVTFADGTAIDAVELDAALRASFSHVPTPYADLLVGTSGDDALSALDGNDVVRGDAGDDTLDGGAGYDWLFGGDGQDMITGGVDPDHVWGGAGNDTIAGDDGDDELHGDVGNDTIDGGAGVDIVHGDDGDDTILGGTGNDTLYGDAGDDTIDGGADNDHLYGGDGNDLLQAGDDAGPTNIANTLDGGAGDDTLIGGGGPDALSGGDGNDVLRGGDGADSLSGGIGNDVLDGGDGDDYLYDEAGDDTLIGGSGDDVLQAFAGDDILDGGPGADVLYGGSGVDTYVLKPGGGIDTVEDQYYYGDLVVISVDPTLAPGDVSLDREANCLVVSANGGADALRVNQYVDPTTPVEIRFGDGTVWDSTTVFDQLYVRHGTPGNDTLIAGGTGNFQLYGYAGNDTLIGGAGSDLLDGGTGADSMTGGGGNDTYIVDDPGDVVVAATYGYDTVKSSIGYVLPANVEALVLTSAASLNGTGNSLANSLTGTSGNNVLDGKAGADTMVGGAGNDTYVVDNAGDVVIESAGEGTDLVQSGITYTLGANLENLTLTGASAISGTGNAMDNVLIGNAAANTLTGGLGNDQLDGGAGADTLKGGAGDDSYVVDNAADVITELAGDGTDTARSSVTYTIGANVESLILTGASAINGTGNTLNNTLTGNAAANTLNGGTGADTMIGGLGNDTYVVDNVGDIVTENAGEGTDLVQAGISYALGANLENLTLTGTGAINATGNGLNNALTGNGGNNVLDGGAGNDAMAGGAGNDTYVVDVTGDVVTEAAGAGTDLVQSAVTYTSAPTSKT